MWRVEPVVDASFEERFDELARLAYRVGYRLLADRGDAEDVAQETLARAFVRWRRIGRYAEPWVVRVATNLALGLLRKRRAPEPRREPISDLEAVLTSRLDLIGLIGSLPRRQREVVALRYLADLPELQVAGLLGCSVGSVKRHTHRATTALRVALDGQGGSDV